MNRAMKAEQQKRKAEKKERESKRNKALAMLDNLDMDIGDDKQKDGKGKEDKFDDNFRLDLGNKSEHDDKIMPLNSIKPLDITVDQEAESLDKELENLKKKR